MPVTGGCQCGAVRYALASTPKGGICHCRMCQKASGNIFAALAAIPVSDLTWTRGKPASFASSNLATRGFCANCGTPLTYQGNGEATLEVMIGTLDDPEIAPPGKQDGIEGRLSWFARLHDLPGEPTKAKFAGVQSRQHPDHDT